MTNYEKNTSEYKKETINNSYSTKLKNWLLPYIIIWYIKSRTFTVSTYYYIKTTFIKHETIKGTSCNTNTINNLMYKYFLMCVLGLPITMLKYLSYSILSLSNRLENVARYLGGTYNSLQVQINNYDTYNTCIIDRPITLYDYYNGDGLIRFKHLEKQGIRIFNTFKFKNSGISLKEYLINYKDNDGMYDNTLNNILIFNKFNMDKLEDESLELAYFDGRRKITKVIPLESVLNKHINYFYNHNFQQ